MNAIQRRRATATRYRIRSRSRRYLARTSIGAWYWTSVRADARIFRRLVAAEKRAAIVGGRVEVARPGES